MPLSLILNGQPRIFPTLSDTSTLDLLVAELGLKSDRVAVEHNGEIVSRSAWPRTRLMHNDKMEVVHFVGGGI
jgi:sulfur carrier protein